MGHSTKPRKLLLAAALGIGLAASPGSATATTPTASDPVYVSDLTKKQLCRRFSHLYDSIFASSFMCTLTSTVSLAQQGIDLSMLADSCRQSVRDCSRTFFPKPIVCTSDQFDNLLSSCGAKITRLDACFADLEARFANAFAPLNDLITCSIFDPLKTGDTKAFEAELISLQAAVTEAQATIQTTLSAPLPKSCKRLQRQCQVLQNVTP